MEEQHAVIPPDRAQRGHLTTAALAAVLSILILAVVMIAGRPTSPAGAAAGDMGSWASSSSLPEKLWAFSAVAGRSQILVFGGEIAGVTNTASVRRAPITPDGTLGSWAEQPAFALSTPRIDYGAAAGTASGYSCIYVAGGFGPDPSETITKSVEYYQVGSDLSLISRGFTSSMNSPRAHFGLVISSTTSGGYVYAVGGVTAGGVATKTVEFAPIRSDCTLGAWTPIISSLSANRGELRSFIGRGFIYAVGGLAAGGVATKTVEFAPINGDGALGTWLLTNSLNSARAELALAFDPGTNNVYALGGFDASFAPLASVERATVFGNGNLSTWSTQAPLPTARENMAYAVANGRIYLIGGRGPSGILDTVEFAPLEGAVPSIAGMVLAPDGVRIVGNVDVQLWPGDNPPGPSASSKRSGQNGFYDFTDLAAGTHTLQASVSSERLDYANGPKVTATVETTKTTYANVAVNPVNVLGQVKAPDGTVITRPVQNSAQGARANIQNGDRSVNAWATANSAGYYKHGGLVTDTYTLQSFPPFTGSFSLLGPSPQRVITLTPGLSQTLNLTLTVPAITGTVMSPNSLVVTRTNVSLWDDKRTIQRNVTSNDTGQFAMGRVAQGPYWLQASPPGDGRFAEYAQSTPRLVDIISGTTSFIGNITLTVPSVTGTVTLPNGDPQSGASVSVYNSNHSVSFGVGADANGRFKVRELPSGDYFVRANPPSGSAYAASLAKKVKVTSGATINAGALQLTTPCISGRVTDPSGSPLLRTGVGYYSADAANPVREGTGVDQNGRFSIGGLTSGDYFVQGNPPAGSPYISSNPVRVAVVATNTTCSPINVGDLALRAPGLRGRVLEPDGDPVARAGLTIRKADRSLSFGAGSDENGLFRTSPVPDGDYVVTASPPAGSDLGSSLPITITGVVSGTTKDVGDVRLTLLSAIGRILLPDGNPALKTSVHIYTDSRNVDKRAGTDSRGIFRISGLDPGVYRLELDVPWDSTGLIAPPAQQVTVVAGQTTNLLDISYLRATKHISGQVLKRNADGTTSAVAGAIVNGNKEDGKARASEKTGADGRYTLDVGGGVWLVSVGPDRSPGAPAVDWTYGQPPTGVSFKPDTTEEAKTLDFAVISAGATVRGAVRLPDGTVPALDTVSVGVRDDSGFSTGARLGADGSFSLRAPGGVYRLGIRSNDPTLAMPLVPPFSVGSTEDKDLGTIKLVSKDSRITGRVLDGSGQGVSDIEVQAWIKGGGGLISTRTITDGVYSLMAMSGAWEVQARPGLDSDYTITTPPSSVTLAGNDTKEVNFSLLATDATILGKIVDSGLNVLSDFEGRASVVKENPGLPPTPMGGAQIKGGVFTLNLPSGSNYRIFASCPPGCRYSVLEERGLAISANETRRLNLTARGADATIAGSVVDSSGSLVQNLRATVRAVSPLGGQRTDLTASGAYTMAVTAGTWHMGLWVDPNSGYVWEQIPLSTTVSTGVTATVNYTVTRADAAISGTVRDPNGSTLDGAWVWADLPRTSASPARFVKGQVSKDGGKYSLQLPSGTTYNIRAAVAEERGYISPEMVAVTITVPATITQDLQFRRSDAQIQGVVTLGGSAHAAFIRAWGEKGGHWTATAGNDGSYTLSVTKNDRWRIVAVSEVGGTLYRSDPAIISVGETTPIIYNLTLKEVGTVPTSVSITFDASQMQVISLSDGAQVTIPGGALAVSGTVSVLAVPKSNVPAQKGAEPLSLGYDLAATDADGNAITSFLRNVTVVINYTEAQLAALGVTEDQVVAKYWDTTTSTWKTPDNLIQDRENNTLTISTNHFTVFAGILGSGEVTAGALTKIYVPFAAKNSSGGW